MGSSENIQVMKALSDSTRLAIIEHLTEGESCVCELLEHFAVTQPTLSHHLRILSEAGLVKSRRDGKWIHYSINEERLVSFQSYIASIRVVSAVRKGYSCQ